MVVASAGWEMTIWLGWAAPGEADASRRIVIVVRHGARQAARIKRQCTAADGRLATTRKAQLKSR
jgi:hypothetical protein